MLSAVPVRGELALVVIAFVLLSGCGAKLPGSGGSTAPAADSPLVGKLASAVTDTGAFTHLQALQQIADQHGGNRAAPSPGYDASVEYVVGALRKAGYDVSTPTYEASGEDSDSGSHGDGTRSSGATLRNVIAQSHGGDPDHVVMIGAHLDSVTKGPGIVDDGSGVAALLEIANQLGATTQTRNTVRFAFFGSEEEGALGSAAYVKSLSKADRQKILLYLNVDMVASPNGGYLVQGGQGDDRSATGPEGSATIAKVLADQLKQTGVTAETIEFVGDDEAPFVKAGIPSGGAENGDRKKKTEEQASAWGGQAAEVYDRCYHSACDRLENINRVVLTHYLRAIAGTLAHFATSDEKLAR
ncbi:MAG TPA: M20/M25/M40 family metallo-hydrolase [Pseudonocardia sp.]|nr:M20/M25/M40 family metallo-hydrolase [Pseudonocardia sp.]